MPVPAAPRGICGDGAQQAQTEPADAGSPDGELLDEAQEGSEPDAAAQALLDALPEEVTADTAEEVAAQLAPSTKRWRSLTASSWLSWI